MHISILAPSAPLELLIFKKSNFCNYVMLRNRGATKLPSRELCKMLNEMSHSNSVYHLMYLRYYALKFKFRKIDFSQKFASHVTSFFRYLTHFWWWIWWYSQNFKIKTFYSYATPKSFLRFFEAYVLGVLSVTPCGRRVGEPM